MYKDLHVSHPDQYLSVHHGSRSFDQTSKLQDTKNLVRLYFIVYHPRTALSLRYQSLNIHASNSVTSMADPAIMTKLV